jgi:uncharacterized protein
MSNKNPLRTDHVYGRSIGKKAILYDSMTNLVHVVNMTAYFVWNMCDGLHQIGDIVGALADSFEIDDDVNVNEDVKRIINTFQDMGLVRTDHIMVTDTEGQGKGQFIQRVKRGNVELTPEERMLAGVIGRAEELKADNLAFLIKRQRHQNGIPPRRGLVDDVVVKPVGKTCNLQCRYCYEFSHAEQESMLQGAEGNYPSVMEKDILEETISKVLSLLPSRVCFSWHGGEPLLAGMDFYENVVNFIEKYRKYGQEVTNSIQTNGTLLDDRWITFFQKNSFIVGVSLDGSEELHDRYRQYPDGRGTYRDVIRGIKKLEKSAVKWGIIGVLTSDTNPEVFFDYFVRSKIFDFYANPRCDTGAYLPREEYLDFMKRIFDCWLKSGNPQIRIESLDNFMWNLLGYTPRLCSMDGACNRFVTIEVNGDTTPGCTLLSHFYERKINIKDADFSRNLRRELAAFSTRISAQEEKYCSSCTWRAFCHGGCTYNKILRSGKVEGKDYYCEVYQNLFEYISETINHVIK